MKRVEVVNPASVKVSPFILNEFMSPKDTSIKPEKVTKKAVRDIANELGISYDESHIEFAKKLINAYVKS
ncbi:hypothetical protein PGH07_04020 [Sulfurovum sp. zt1-1]|uniref:Uncharacterized protein n=1 Tax=Sulfurovum zhangzhouensis TaxID=3019067 RepID=A0ABT7QWY0_9BACT|nr:hypothetical protein [Sulfurovum zhangzhouensis]MDM5271334.1 hypothetical protein [Sulfurovum zhangzhouensis]